MTKTLQGKSRDHRGLEDVVVDIPDEFGTDNWVRELRLRYRVQDESPVNETTVFFDTFDGRLFDKGLACSICEGIVRLQSLANPGTEAEAAVEPLPAFVAEFPEGKLKERLRRVVRNRALLKVLSMSTARRSWRILNVDQKTVARVVLEDVKVGDEAQTAHLGPFLVLKPVRGYEGITVELEEWFEERGLNRLGGSVYSHALRALHKNPKASRPGACLELTGSMQSADAVRILLDSLYETVRLNEAGVLADTDTEFLHDYRVAVRKARSLLRLTQGVFAPGPTQRFGQSLSWLGRATNALRDLDVYLLQQSEYRSLLHDPLDEGIVPFFAFLEAERKKAFGALVFLMSSERYVNVMSGWGMLVKDPALLGLGRKGVLPIEKLAAVRMAKKSRRVLQRGYELTDATDPATLHALRIQCKHLRYLIEFFADFVPAAKSVIRRIKKLQDTLGKIQDLSVHEERLRLCPRDSWVPHEARANTALAAERLMGSLRAERDLEQKRVLKLFRRFNRSLSDSTPPYALLLPWLRVD